MKHLFIQYELAKLAKEKGFNEKPMLAFYRTSGESLEFCNPIEYGWNNDDFNKNNHVAAPLYQQLVDWFREKHGIEIYCQNYYRDNKEYQPEYECRINGKQLITEYSASSGVNLFVSYYKALDYALTEAFKLI